VNTKVCYVTSSDTGVGKTVVSVLLTRHLLASGVNVRSVKPMGSGGRDDAVALRACQPEVGSLDEINPWSFSAPLTPMLAARKRRARIHLKAVRSFLSRAARGREVLLVEGAGGLLSPVGEGFSARELIEALNATPIVVCANRLGVLNQALLVLDALPAAAVKRAQVVLVNGPRKDLSTRSNAALLRELSGAAKVHEFPWLGSLVHPVSVPIRGPLKRVLTQLAAGACSLR